MTTEQAEKVRKFHGLSMTTAERLIKLEQECGHTLEVRGDAIFRRIGFDFEPALAWKGDDGLWYTSDPDVRDEIRERLDLVVFLD